MEGKRVVITGMGCISPLGNDIDTFWKNALNGESGAITLTEEDFPNIEDYKTRVVCKVNGFDPKAVQTKNISPILWHKMDPFCQFGVASAVQAAQDSGIDFDAVDRTRFGAIIGSGIGGMEVWGKNYEAYQKGPKRVSPYFIPMLISNMAAGMVAIEFKIHGPNFSISSACATSNHTIGTAYDHIKFGKADIMFAGGSEAACNGLGIAGFMVLQAISKRNDEPKKASRPFDKDRDGFVMGEGGGVVILEELEHAKKRGAKIYAEMIGWGLSDDGHHMAQPAPNGEFSALAMENALADAGITPTEVDYINTHGTSTPQGDPAECQAIQRVFGDHCKNGLVVSSTKSMTGHLLGAAGGIECIATALTCKNDIIPPTINLENQDPACDLDVCPNEKREKSVKIALSNSFGFGGHNATLVIKKYSD